jgi:hypothetical protein
MKLGAARRCCHETRRQTDRATTSAAASENVGTRGIERRQMTQMTVPRSDFVQPLFLILQPSPLALSFLIHRHPARMASAPPPSLASAATSAAAAIAPAASDSSASASAHASAAYEWLCQRWTSQHEMMQMWETVSHLIRQHPDDATHAAALPPSVTTASVEQAAAAVAAAARGASAPVLSQYNAQTSITRQAN